jgi:hypothetical protein
MISFAESFIVTESIVRSGKRKYVVISLNMLHLISKNFPPFLIVNIYVYSEWRNDMYEGVANIQVLTITVTTMNVSTLECLCDAVGY